MGKVPMATIRSPRIARSPFLGDAPVPSMSVPPRRTDSACEGEGLASAGSAIEVRGATSGIERTGRYNSHEYLTMSRILLAQEDSHRVSPRSDASGTGPGRGLDSILIVVSKARQSSLRQDVMQPESRRIRMPIADACASRAGCGQRLRSRATATSWSRSGAWAAERRLNWPSLPRSTLYLRAARDEERGDLHPLGDRARRTPGGRAALASASTTSCASWPPRSWPRRGPARRSRLRRWCTRLTSGWSVRTRTSPGRTAAISSPPPPRRCVAS